MGRRNGRPLASSHPGRGGAGSWPCALGQQLPSPAHNVNRPVVDRIASSSRRDETSVDPTDTTVASRRDAMCLDRAWPPRSIPIPSRWDGRVSGGRSGAINIPLRWGGGSPIHTPPTTRVRRRDGLFRVARRLNARQNPVSGSTRDPTPKGGNRPIPYDEKAPVRSAPTPHILPLSAAAPSSFITCLGDTRQSGRTKRRWSRPSAVRPSRIRRGS